MRIDFENLRANIRYDADIISRLSAIIHNSQKSGTNATPPALQPTTRDIRFLLDIIKTYEPQLYAAAVERVERHGH